MELSRVNKHNNSMIEYKHQLTLSRNHATAVLISYEEGLYKHDNMENPCTQLLPKQCGIYLRSLPQLTRDCLNTTYNVYASYAMPTIDMW